MSQIGFLASGGTTPYTYSAYDATGLAIVINAPVPITGNLTIGSLVPGCYSIILKDANGCTDIKEQCIKSNAVTYTVSNTPTQPTCGCTTLNTPTIII